MTTAPNLLCLLPAVAIGVTFWDIHPCRGGLYMREAWCYGPRGRIGYWMDPEPRP